MTAKARLGVEMARELPVHTELNYHQDSAEPCCLYVSTVLHSWRKFAWSASTVGHKMTWSENWKQNTVLCHRGTYI